MNNLIELLEKDGAERTPEQNDALYMHEQLIIHRQMVEVGLASMCRDLKDIRDRKLYSQLGYDDFGAYTEAEHGIKQRQAYKYIQVYEKLGVEILHSSAKIGVTKLLELASLDKDERENLLAQHDIDELAGMSTEGVKRLADDNRKLREQITFLQETKAEPQTVIQQPLDEVKAEIEGEVRYEIEEQLRAEYEDRIQALQDKAAEDLASSKTAATGISDEEFVKFKANAEKEAKAIAAGEVKKAKEESAEELKKLKADLKAAKEAEKTKEDAVKKAEDARKAAEEKAKAGEDALKRAAELEAKVKTAEAEKEAIEKQIKLSNNPELTRFKFLFEDFKRSSNSMMEQHAKLDDEKKASTLKAIKLMLEGLGL